MALADGMNKIKSDTDRTAQPRILLVNDDEIVRESPRGILEMTQFLVATVADVAEWSH
jgi:hypothetical protein